jgi:hypothetical protein
MRIAFICGSLEPGRDGVGDYTTRLAMELSQNGYEASIVAIHDLYLSSIYDSEEQLTREVVKILRIPSTWPSKPRLSKVHNWISHINPEWISLQFVPFSFHRKGLPFFLKNELARLGKGRRWHIMFHELWVGMSTTSSKKHMVWGWMQKKIINSLHTRLKPTVTQTQCMLYYLQLKDMGIDVSRLPLFSNIPVDSAYKQSSQLSRSDALLCSIEISIIMFGTIHPQASLDKLLNQLNDYRQKSECTISLTLVGNMGEYKKNWISKFQQAGISVQVHGEQHVECISKLLTKATFGVTTSAPATIEKSGTVAAMLEHSLPVICVGDCWEPRKFNLPSPPPGVYTLKEGCIEEVLNSRFSISPGSISHDYSISAVAKTFVEALQKSAKNVRS